MSNTTSLGELERWSGGFPGAHEFSNLDGLDPELGEHIPAIKAAGEKLVRSWSGGQFVGLYLYGTPGTGKTHGAIGIARAIHDIGGRVTYANARFFPDAWSIHPSNWTADPPDEKTPGVRYAFPETFSYISRNPKSVLVLDEYTPDKILLAAAATEAAAEFGGLVIITSNSPDPFDLVEPQPVARSGSEIITDAFAERANPEAMAQAQEIKNNRLAVIRDSMMSRVATGFKLIECTGVDQRLAQDRFWD